MNNAKSLTRKWKTPLQIVIEVIMPYINWNCSNRKWNIGMFCLGRHAQTYLRWIHTPGPRVKTIPEFQSVGPGGPRAKESTWKMNPWKRHFFPPFFYLREARLLKGPLSLSAYLKLQYGNLLSFEIQIPQRSHRKRLYFLFCLIFELPEFLVDCLFSSGRLARPAGDSGESHTFSGTLGFWISAIFVSVGI